MEYIARFFGIIVDGFKMPIIIYGFTFSLWEIFIFIIIAGMVVGALVEFFSD